MIETTSARRTFGTFAQIAAVIGGGLAIAPLSWLATRFVNGHVTAWWNPATLPSFVIGMFAAEIADAIAPTWPHASDLGGLLAGPLLFYICCFPLFRGSATVPERSWMALAFLTGLAVIEGIGGMLTGARVQGLEYAARVLSMEAAGLGIAWILFFLARERPAFGRNLAFHLAAVAWFVWLSFPILGHFDGP